ncbi:flagellar hook-length control protein FliK [Halanaerobium kushneri]|uniref:Hook-length control protein FliK n=1 Tax=Halanaerobium kushneri TaxID=56779 RepID=A0A1N6YF44_9FIRM|nr:flagellar hook-length control protein FliK [Halanaerobium kushneri]SIR13184.1 hook-length control protein FliK [Halanaerobium kushneri]
MDLNGLAPIRKLDIGILRQALNTDNITTDESQGKSENAELLPEIFRLLASLEDDSQKMLLDSWAKMEMPLTEKTVANLIQYLGDNPATNAEDKMAVIKAFAFLESNNLPFSEKFVNALRSVFSNNGNLGSILEQFINSDNQLSSNQLNNLLSQLNITELKNSLNNINNLDQQNQNTVNQETGPKTNLNFINQNSETTVNNFTDQTNNNLNPQILNNFSQLDQEFKNIILNNLNKLNQDFDRNTLKILNNFLTHNNVESSSEKLSLVKAFAFLENNKLPLSENLIKETAAKFEQNISQFTESLTNKNQIFTNLNQQNSPLLNRNESAVNLDNPAQNIAESLSAHSKISDQILSLFNRTGGENEEKIADNILGQKLINLQQQSQNTPLMLALEIPVQLPNNKLSSLLLKIEEDRNGESENKKAKKGYNISFILEFENIGPIQTKINVDQKNINTTIFTESAQTADLIEANFNSLQSNLKNEGFTINSFRIKNFSNLKSERDDFFNNLILNELNEFDDNGNYRHIDIKI